MPVTVDQLLEYVSRGHAYAQHVEGLGSDSRGPRNGVNEFTRDTRLPINRPEDLKDYMNRLLDSPETRGYVRNDGSVVLYNSRDNVRIVFNQARGEVDLGTTYPQTDGGASFNRELARERTSGSPRFRELDNARTPGSVRTQVEGFARSVPATHPALARQPGEAARADYPNSRNAQQGMSPDYRLSSSTAFVRASGVESGRGYVAGVGENGLPSRMFFMDERANRVTEINNGRVTVHTFDNLPAGERTAAARQFFEINRPPQATVSEGGVRGLVREFQSHNTGRAQLSEGVVNNAIRADLIANNNAVRPNVPYQNSAEVTQAAERAVQAYIGFDAGQASAFNRMPTQISAADLARVQDPRVVGALRDLAVAKDLTMSSTGAERVAGLRLFAETFNSMDAGTRAGVMTALEGMNATADAARAARGLDAASDLAEVARALKAGRMASNMGKAGVITTVVLTATAVAMTDRANAMTLDLAGQLHASGRLSPEAYREYRQMMSEVGPMLTAQAADPFPTAIPGMAIVERIAYNRFKEFSDRHQLPQDVHEMLSPSIVAGTSLRGEIGQDTYRMIPSDPSAAPPALRGLAEAKRGLEAAQTDYRQTYNQHRPSPLVEAFILAGTAGPGGTGLMMHNPVHQMVTSVPQVQAAQQRVDVAQSAFQREFDRALADPQGARALASLMTTDQLLEVVKATAKFNTGGQQHPLIQNLVNAQQRGLTGLWARMEAESALRQNPQVMRDYLSNLFVPRPQIRAAADVENNAATVMVATADLESNPGFTAVAGAFERMKCGDTLDAAEQAEIRRVLNSTDEEGQAVAEEIKARYPEQAAQFVSDDDEAPAVNPAQLPQDGVRHGNGGQQVRGAAP